MCFPPSFIIPLSFGQRREKAACEATVQSEGEQAKEFSETNTPYHSCAVENFRRPLCGEEEVEKENCFKAESHSTSWPISRRWVIKRHLESLGCCSLFSSAALKLPCMRNRLINKGEHSRLEQWKLRAPRPIFHLSCTHSSERGSRKIRFRRRINLGKNFLHVPAQSINSTYQTPAQQNLFLLPPPLLTEQQKNTTCYQ